MILNKKGLAVLPLAALLFTSCAKNVSYEDACNFVRENYTSTEEKTPTSGYIELRGKTNNEEAKKQIIEIAKQYGIELDNNLYGKRDFKEEELKKFTDVPLTEEYIWHGGEDITYTYTIKGKNFTQSMRYKEQKEGGQQEYQTTCDYDDKGYFTKMHAKESAKIVVASGDIEVTTETTQHLKY